MEIGSFPSPETWSKSMVSAENPMVHRSVRTGAVTLIFGALQFVAAMIVVQSQ